MVDKSILIKDMELEKNFDWFEGELTEVKDTKEFISEKTGKLLRVKDMRIKDDAGDGVQLTLFASYTHPRCDWRMGDKVIIINGYLKEYEGARQITLGKLGVITRARIEEKVKKKK